ncbi:retrovirus-related pol polyprotein from transposon TNT 1-94 [Tanacetum coccineum]
MIVKADEGFFVGYSVNSIAFRVFNSRTRIVKENLHIRFSESTPNVVGSRPDWLFDIDALTRTMNYDQCCSTTIYSFAVDDSRWPDMNNLDTIIQVSPIPTTKFIRSSSDQVIGDLNHKLTNKKDVKEFGGTWDEPKKCFSLWEDEEEGEICQPPRFEDPDFPDRVYKVEKALYGLHQAPRAWYETLSTYLLDNGFQRGKIDKILFIKRHKDDDLKESSKITQVQGTKLKDHYLMYKDKFFFIASVWPMYDSFGSMNPNLPNTDNEGVKLSSLSKVVSTPESSYMTIESCGSFRSFFLDVVKSLSLEYEHVAMNLTLLERGRFIIRTSLTRFPAQSVRSSNADALDLLYLLVSLYRTPQSRLPH